MLAAAKLCVEERCQTPLNFRVREEEALVNSIPSLPSCSVCRSLVVLKLAAKNERRNEEKHFRQRHRENSPFFSPHFASKLASHYSPKSVHLKVLLLLLFLLHAVKKNRLSLLDT